MTVIFCDPDEADSLSHLNPKICEGLEALTGADFCLSQLPINPVSNIGWHIEHDTFWINTKRGYDLPTNHDSPKNEAARMQALGIKPGRFILLGVGVYINVKGTLKVSNGKEPYKEPATSIDYKTFQQTIKNNQRRGLQWLTIDSSKDLAEWIEIWGEPLKEKSITVLSKPSYDWKADDFWQEVTEPAKDSIESILACGLPDFGPKKALATIQYLKNNQLPLTLFNALMVLSTCDLKGKRVFKVPMVGDSTFKLIRRILYGDRPFNTLNVSTIEQQGNFQEGARAALEQFHALFEEKLKAGQVAKVAYSEAMNITKNSLHELVAF